jgi:hypothetical protein
VNRTAVTSPNSDESRLRLSAAKTRFAARSALVSAERLVVRFRTASCYRKARFWRASSRCDFRVDRAVASMAYSKSIIGVG